MGGRNRGECCFDVKGDGWSVLRRTREEKNKDKRVKRDEGGEDMRKTRLQTVRGK